MNFRKLKSLSPAKTKETLRVFAACRDSLEELTLLCNLILAALGGIGRKDLYKTNV